jgi:acyl-CoA dehydrogenase
MDGFDGTGGALRRDLRRFLRQEAARGGWDPLAGSFGRFDAGFSARLGAHGYIGVDWPPALGGLGGTRLDRLIVAEELLAHGAPLRAHWAAERLLGLLLLQHGTPAQQRELLPRIAAGRLSLCLGIEEAAVSPDPLAMRCRAMPVAGGWRITGRKFPVADAGEAQRLLLLARTGEEPDPADRQRGFGLFLLDLALPGVSVRPLASGDPGLPLPSEVTFDQVFLAGDRLLGPAEEGLPTLLAIAAALRGGPEGWMRDWPLLTALAAAPGDPLATGRLVAEAFALHCLGQSEAARDTPATGAARLATAQLATTQLATTLAEAVLEAAQRLPPEARLAQALRIAEAAVAWNPQDPLQLDRRRSIR